MLGLVHGALCANASTLIKTKLYVYIHTSTQFSLKLTMYVFLNFMMCILNFNSYKILQKLIDTELAQSY